MRKIFTAFLLSLTANIAHSAELDCVNLDLPGTVTYGYEVHPSGRTANLQFTQGTLSGQLICGIAESGRIQLACAGKIIENTQDPLERYVRLRLHRIEYGEFKLAVVQVYSKEEDPDTIATAFPMRCNFF